MLNQPEKKTGKTKKKKKTGKKLAKSSKPAGGKILKKKLHIGQQKLWNTKLTTSRKAKTIREIILGQLCLC